MILVLLDVVLKNYFNINSFLFIMNINNKFKSVLLMALFMDIFIHQIFFINTFIILILNFLNKKIKKNNLLKKYFFDLINLLSYLLIMNLLFNKIDFNLLNIFFVNAFIYLISYILKYFYINLSGMKKYGKYRRYHKSL